MKQKQKNTESSWTRKKQKQSGFLSASHNVILFESLISNHAKKSTCLYVSVYSKVLPNLDENHDYYILHDIKNEKKRKKYYPPHVHQCLFKNLYEKNTLLFSITAFFLSLH